MLQAALGQKLGERLYAAQLRKGLDTSFLDSRRTVRPTPAPVDYTDPKIVSYLASKVTADKKTTPAPMSSILNAVLNTVGNLFSSDAPAVGPATPQTTTGTLINTIGNVASSVISGNPLSVAGSTALAVLPGRANTPSTTQSGGMSTYLLESPTGGSGGGAMTGLKRLGIFPPWTRKKVRNIVRLVGVGQASAIIGAPLESVAIVAISGGRRRRGISSRDLATTKRVTRRVLGMARDLAALRPAAPRRAASRTRVICN